MNHGNGNGNGNGISCAQRPISTKYTRQALKIERSAKRRVRRRETERVRTTQSSRVVSCTRKIGKRCDVQNMRTVGCSVIVPCLVSCVFFSLSLTLCCRCFNRRVLFAVWPKRADSPANDWYQTKEEQASRIN